MTASVSQRNQDKAIPPASYTDCQSLTSLLENLPHCLQAALPQHSWPVVINEGLGWSGKDPGLLSASNNVGYCSHCTHPTQTNLQYSAGNQGKMSRIRRNNKCTIKVARNLELFLIGICTAS